MALVALERGISVSGAEFTPVAGSGPAETTMAFSNLNLQTYNSDYHYEGVPGSGGANRRTFSYLAGRGWRYVKIPTRWERLGSIGSSGATTCPLNSGETTRLTAELDQVNLAGLKAFIDVHNYGNYFIDGSLISQTANTGYRQCIGNAVVTQAAYADFWSRMTTQFLSHPAVAGVHLMNEPQANGGLTRAAWYSAAQAAVTAIRAVDTTGQWVIRVGGWAFSDCFNWAGNNTSSLVMTDSTGGPVWYEAHHYWSETEDGNYTTYANAVSHAQTLGYTASLTFAGATYTWPDALYSKLLDDLHGFQSWLDTNGHLTGVIGETSWPNNATAPDQVSWNALAGVYLRECDRLGLHVDGWSCGEFYSYPGSDPLPFYSADGGQTSGIDVTRASTAPWETDLVTSRYAPVYPPHRGST